LELIILVRLRAFCRQKPKKSHENAIRKALIDNVLAVNPTKSHHKKITSPIQSHFMILEPANQNSLFKMKTRPLFSSDLTYLTVKLSLLLSAP
jgi:hypothetical protein